VGVRAGNGSAPVEDCMDDPIIIIIITELW